jgi:23S rRNA pseudouridine2605 synthase
VRRVLEALGLAVNRLIRIAYGPFALADLEPGAVEEVSPREIREHLAKAIAPANLPAGERALYEPPPATKSASPHRAKSPPKRGPRAPPADPPRKTYKAGWAKPKPRSRAKRP